MQVPILDPGIHISAGYTPYEEGIAQDVFIKDVTGQPYVGQVWLLLHIRSAKSPDPHSCA